MSQLTIVSFNVANAVNDEKDQVYRFGLRFNKIIQLISASSPDIVCIQEIRRCMDVDGVTVMEPFEIASKFAKELKLNIAGFHPTNQTELSFWRLTLYDPSKVFPTQSFSEWASSTPNIISGKIDLDPMRQGVEVQFTKFYRIKDKLIDNENSFLVVNTHFPLIRDDKLNTARYLCSRIPSLGDKCIIVGDYNTFMDDGGEEQLNILRSTFFEASHNIIETFTTFPQDFMAKKMGHLISSKLDHVFSYPIDFNNLDCNAVTTKGSRESDHYMIVIKL